MGDREIVALGGLLDDNESRTLEKVPFLGDIPVIGELFKSRGRSKVKTNLMVFIRPTILRNAADRAALTARRYGIVRGAQTDFDPKQEPSIDELIVDYMGAVPPSAPQAEVAVVLPTDTLIRPRAAPVPIEQTELPPSSARN